jgi:hypothetical protein
MNQRHHLTSQYKNLIGIGVEVFSHFLTRFLLLVSMFLLHFSASAWSPFGPNNFNDCIIQNMKGVTSDTAAASIRHSCRQKFPEKSPPQKQELNTRIGYPRLDIWDKHYNHRVFNNINISKTRPNNYGGLAVTITNKNEFTLTGIYIGVSSDKKPGKCSIEKSDYVEIHECNGNIDSNTTKTLTCTSPQGQWCLVGFKADLQMDVDKFFRDIAR